jgi:hypothetical protein
LNPATWNSLEIVKLLVAGLTPVLVAIVGFWLNRRLKSLEQAQWSQQKIIERRIRAYDELAGPLNDLYCFFCYVGSWKEFQPPDIVKMKRQVDRTAHISAPLFAPDFLGRYNALLDACFATFGSWGEDAKLRTLPDRRKDAAGETWQPAWNECFAAREKATDPSAVKGAYRQLMAYLGRAMGAEEVEAHLLASAPVPGNFDRRAVGMVSRTASDEEIAEPLSSTGNLRS